MSTSSAVDGIQILEQGDGPELAIIDGDGSARAIVWPGLGAHDRSLHRLSLGPGARTVELRHPSEAVYYVIAGAGSVAGTVHGDDDEVGEGSMVHVPPGGAYAFIAGNGGLELVGGPCPPDPALYEGSPHAGGATLGHRSPETSGAQDPALRILHRDRPDRMLPMIAEDARLVVWPGVGAHTANMNYVDMRPGEENVPHSHPVSEDTLFVLDGKGSVDDLTNGVTLEFQAGQIVHIPRGLRHCVRADRDSRIESVGGPCPADLQMLRAAGALPEEG